jgi:hypothetical protein
MAQLSAYMEDFHPRFVLLIQYEPFHEHKKYLMRVLSAVCSFCFISLLFDRTKLSQLKDLMWSDPEDIENWAVSPRGAGWLFGGSVVKEVKHCIAYFIPPFFSGFCLLLLLCLPSQVQSRQFTQPYCSRSSTSSRRFQIHVR